MACVKIWKRHFWNNLNLNKLVMQIVDACTEEICKKKNIWKTLNIKLLFSPPPPTYICGGCLYFRAQNLNKKRIKSNLGCKYLKLFIRIWNMNWTNSIKFVMKCLVELQWCSKQKLNIKKISLLGEFKRAKYPILR